MSLQFSPLTDQAEEKLGSEPARLGVVLFDKAEEKWYAARPDLPIKSGFGAPEAIAPGLWVLGLPFEESRAIPAPRYATFRSDSWLKQSLGQVRTAFGLTNQPTARVAPVIAAIADRTFRASQEAIAENMAACGYSSLESFQSKLQRSSSLATGLAQVMAVPLSLSGTSEKVVRNEFEQAFQSGIYFAGKKDADEGTILLNFHFPRLDYALRVADAPVPGNSPWGISVLHDQSAQDDFVATMRGIEQPLIIRAICNVHDGYAPEHIQAFANSFGGRGGATFRTRFTVPEIEILMRYYEVDIQSVIAGQSWQQSATGKILRSLESIAGGPEAARASWSVGLAAENILAAAYRPINKSSPGTRAEAIWIAARDRCMMLEAIEQLTSVGGTVTSANCGNITVKCPEDPELLMILTNAAWEAGLVLPLEDVARLEELGVPAPVEEATFGGREADLRLSTIIHTRNRKALWDFDQVLDKPATARAKEFNRLLAN